MLDKERNLQFKKFRLINVTSRQSMRCLAHLYFQV